MDLSPVHLRGHAGKTLCGLNVKSARGKKTRLTMTEKHSTCMGCIYLATKS